jgi:hypothetical protein
LISEFYYHITNKLWPKKIKLHPRVRGKNRSPLEPNIKRICVSDTISGCLASIGPCYNFHDQLYVYRTYRKIIANEPFDIYDSDITNEKWLLKSTSFIYKGCINWKNIPKEIENYNLDENEIDKKKQLKFYNKCLKLEKQNKLIL